MQWIREETVKAKEAGTKWVIYNHGTVMLNRFANYERALAFARRYKPTKAALWQKLYDAILKEEGEQLTASYGTQCYNRPYLGTPLNITQAMRVAMRTAVANAKYQIVTGFDAWQGYRREINEFLGIAALNPNVVQYGGDSHADWAGIHCVNGSTILAEFDVGSVTSPSAENAATLPLDYINTAFLEGSRDYGLRYAQNGNKGFILVELDERVHHAEYIHVDTWCSLNYKATCDVAFDYFAAPNNNNQRDLVRSRCRPVPDVPPYKAIMELNGEFNQASFLRR